MTYSLRELALVITSLCVAMGAYDIGHRQGKVAGYRQADECYKIFLGLYAEDAKLWSQMRDWYLDSGLSIIGTLPRDTESHEFLKGSHARILEKYEAQP